MQRNEKYIRNLTTKTIDKAERDIKKSFLNRSILFGMSVLAQPTPLQRIQQELKETERDILEFRAGEHKRGHSLLNLIESEDSNPRKKRKVSCSALRIFYEDGVEYKNQLIRRSVNLTEIPFLVELPHSMLQHICLFLSLKDLAAVLLVSLDLHHLVVNSRDCKELNKNRSALISKNYSAFTTSCKIGKQPEPEIAFSKNLPDGRRVLAKYDSTYTFHELMLVDKGADENSKGNKKLWRHETGKLFAELMPDHNVLISCSLLGNGMDQNEGVFYANDLRTGEILAKWSCPGRICKILSNGQLAVMNPNLKIDECKFNEESQKFYFDKVHHFPIDHAAHKAYEVLTDVIFINGQYLLAFKGGLVRSINPLDGTHKDLFQYLADQHLKDYERFVFRGNCDFNVLGNNLILLRYESWGLLDRFTSLCVVDLKDMQNPKRYPIKSSFKNARIVILLRNYFAITEYAASKKTSSIYIWNAINQKLIKKIDLDFMVVKLVVLDDGTLKASGFDKSCTFKFEDSVPTIAPEFTPFDQSVSKEEVRRLRM